MTGNETRTNWFRMLAGSLLAAACVSSTGCQVDVAGQTLPSPYYLKDDIQYFPAGPEFKLSNEAAAMREYQAQAAGDLQ